MSLPPPPIGHSYWVVPGRLLAGAYPGDRRASRALEKLRQLLQAGVTLFVDLTEAYEYGLPPYLPLLGRDSPLLQEGEAFSVRTVAHRRMPIPDMGTPSPEEMTDILDTIDAGIAAGRVIYLHCYAGLGRTGTVVGCYLVRHGLRGEEALDEIARLRAGMPDGRLRSPQTVAQHEMVLSWPQGR
jgi:hypothetical protein